MNLLEHFILEIFDISKPNPDKEWITVDMQIGCYGRIERVDHTFMDEADFQRAVNKGYYMA